MLLAEAFQKINRQHFDGFLDEPSLGWNSRLRSSAGRFIPGSRRLWSSAPPRIEVATYLLQEVESASLIEDTMAHEMIHYWLWVRRRPYGHTEEFLKRMQTMGVSRYNPVPRRRPLRYEYRCVACTKIFLTRRRLGRLACAECCRAHSGGRFDSRFLLVLARQLAATEQEGR